MALLVDVGKMTTEELASLEHTLRHILDRDKSAPAYELAMAMKREMRERYDRAVKSRDGTVRGTEPVVPRHKTT